MDAALAIIFFTASLGDMVFRECPRGCLTPMEPPSQMSVGLARVEHRDDWSNREIMLRFDAPIQHGPFQHVWSLGLSATNDIWIGAGARLTTQSLISGPLYLETTFQPGLHFRGDGPDIGGSLHFRSGIGLGYTFDNGAALVLGYDHRSNADRTIPNPGLDTVSIRYAIRLD